MIVHAKRELASKDAASAPRARAGAGLSVCLATLVLALATGTPVQSAQNFLPHPDEEETPYLGV